MQENAIAKKHFSSQQILYWHPSLNVYILENHDILLISASQELYLSAEQFPYFSEIDGLKSADEILQFSKIQKQSALFFYQINQLSDSGLLINAPLKAHYQRPNFDDNLNNVLIGYHMLSNNCQSINLSALSDKKMAMVKSLLLKAVENIEPELKNKINCQQPLSLILVDEFIDLRISKLNIQGYFLIIKITGQKIWISPLFTNNEMVLLLRLQKQILDNQPVRKWLMSKWPEKAHSFAFSVDNDFSEKYCHELTQLIVAQMKLDVQRKLVIYDVKNKQQQYHIVPSSYNVTQDFAKQLNSPIALKNCISRFNSDGGSRSVSAEYTVKQLLPLVSPVTGVINTLEVLEDTTDNPVKIYRTGFFKPQDKIISGDFDPTSFAQTCLGKGVSHIQSKASGLSEAIERYCALYQNDIPLFKSTQSLIKQSGKRCLAYHDLQPFSELQYKNFNNSKHPDSMLKQAVKYYKNNSIHWLPTWSLSHNESVYVPLSQCFSHIPFNDDQFGRWHSNGCAAGNTLEEAILQALFELIERDATAIWWYNRVPRPAFDLSQLDPDNLAKLSATLSPNENTGHDFWVLDLTNDLGIPVMAGIGKDKNTGGWIMGFGCHLNPEMAAQRALTELCQLIPIRDQNGAPFDFNAIKDAPYLYADESAKASPLALSNNNDSNDDIKQNILSIVDRLDNFSLDTLILNYSRAYIPLNTAKVFVPGLCHIWPQLANERLYHVPVSEGWLDVANTENSINQQALYI